MKQNYRYLLFTVIFTSLLFTVNAQEKSNTQKKVKQPNILFCIADDASWQHMSAYGKTKWVKTPGFDRIAKEGLLFMHILQMQSVLLQEPVYLPDGTLGN